MVERDTIDTSERRDDPGERGSAGDAHRSALGGGLGRGFKHVYDRS